MQTGYAHNDSPHRSLLPATRRVLAHSFPRSTPQDNADLAMLSAGARLLNPRELLARIRAAECMLSSESPHGILESAASHILHAAAQDGAAGAGVLTIELADTLPALDAFTANARRRANFGMVPLPPGRLERRRARAATLVQLLMRGAAIVVQTHARLYIALKKKLRSRRRSSTGGGDRLSGAQRRQVMQLFMNNKRGMSAARRINRGWKGQGEPQPTAAVLFGLRWDLEEGDDEDEQRVESTVRIQASFRGYYHRRSEREHREQRRRASTTLQAHWRGHTTRGKQQQQSELRRTRDEARLLALVSRSLDSLDARVHAALGAEAPAIAEMRRRVLRKSVEAHVIRVAARSAAPIDAVAVERLVTAALASLFN